MSLNVRDHFEKQEQACEKLGSGLTAEIMRSAQRLLDTRSLIFDHIRSWNNVGNNDALALRFSGALHYLMLVGEAKELKPFYENSAPVDRQKLDQFILKLTEQKSDFFLRFLQYTPQTNETGRSTMLLPGFLKIAQRTPLPFSLHEIGSSGGLNLFWDKFHYTYGNSTWGNADSPVQLKPEIRGSEPNLDGNVRISSRQGCDIAPLDIHDAEQRTRLQAYIWPDQPERLQRLQAAIRLAESNQFNLKKQDAAQFVQHGLEERKPGEVFLLQHSIMWQYMPQQTCDTIASAMEQAGAKANPENPVAWVSMEPATGIKGHAHVTLRYWDGDTYLGKPEVLAKADYHGRWIKLLTS